MSVIVCRKGDQIVNHIPNCSLFTNKLNLLCTLQAFEKLQLQSQNKLPIFMPLEDYVPLTYKLDDKNDREAYFNSAKRNLHFFSINKLVHDCFF